MSTDPNLMSNNPLRQELQHLRESWLLLLILGILLVLVGIAAMICSFIATLATAIFFGTMLLLGGVIQLVNAVTCRNWRGFFIYLLAGILFAVVGLIMMNHPAAVAVGLTLMLAAAFIVGGIIRIVGGGRRALSWLALGHDQRLHHLVSGHLHLAAFPRDRFLGHWPVHRHRFDLQRHILDHAGHRHPYRFFQQDVRRLRRRIDVHPDDPGVAINQRNQQQKWQAGDEHHILRRPIR